MAKLSAYIIILTGISLLLAFAGIPTLSNQVLVSSGLVLNSASSTNHTVTNVTITSPEDLDSSTSFTGWILNNLALAAIGTGIIVGLVVAFAGVEPVIIGILVLFGGYMGADMVSILRVAQQQPIWVFLIVFAILAPLYVGLWVALINYWRGADTT